MKNLLYLIEKQEGKLIIHCFIEDKKPPKSS